LSYNVAETISISFASTALVSAASSNIVVSPGSFAQLQLLAPGESAAPATPTGKMGIPLAQIAGASFSVTARAVDAFGNFLTNVTDTLALTASDTNAILPTNTPLVAGTRNFSLTLKTSGTTTVTASDVTQPAKTPGTSSIPVNPGAFAKLQLLSPGESAAPGTTTGKTGAPSAQTAGTA